MKVAIIYNRDLEGVINTFGMQNREFYNEKTVRKVAGCLEKAGHNVSVLDGNKQIIERLENFMPRVMEGEQMGMVFNMAYGIQGESRYTHIPSMLEMLGLPYVGSSPSGHALALDKVLTKIIWKNNGLPTPEFWVFSSPEEDLSSVRFPVIVKPKMESVSFGLKVVYNIDDLKEAIHFIVTEFDQQALVEQFIRGREFCVGLLGNSPVESFPVLEIDLEGDPDAIQTVDHKKSAPKRKICPADLPPDLADQMQELSRKAFNALNLRDFSRVDIRLDEDGNIFLLEINSMASLGETGSYPTAAKVAGYDFEKLVNKMLDVASVRYFSNTIMTSLPGEGSGGKANDAARIRSFLRTRQAQTERILKKIVDTDTYIRNVEGVNHCGQIISSELSHLGFTQEIHSQLEVGNILYFTNSYGGETDYLLLLPIDSSIPMSGHENFSEEEQYLEGTGIWERKGGVSILLSALQALRFNRTLKKVKIGILLITDSMIYNRYSVKVIEEKARSAGKVIALSGSATTGGLVLSRSGSALYELENKLVAKGSAENVSTTAVSFHKTVAAIADISRNDTENVIAPNNVQFSSNIFKESAHGHAEISVRFNNREILSSIEEKMHRIIGQQKKNRIFKTRFDGGVKRPAMICCKETEDFYGQILEISRKIDVRIGREHRWSSSDICHISSYQPKVDGLGPVGEYLPSGNERILRHSLIDRALLLALILRNSAQSTTK